jgi:hypothetical protein
MTANDNVLTSTSSMRLRRLSRKSKQSSTMRRCGSRGHTHARTHTRSTSLHHRRRSQDSCCQTGLPEPRPNGRAPPG